MAQHRIQRGRPGVLRIGVTALPPLARTMPWLPLLAGCVAGGGGQCRGPYLRFPVASQYRR